MNVNSTPAKKRLNDTSALVGRPLEPGESHSICTEKIDNGYLTRVSTYNPATGENREAKKFSETPPQIEAPTGKPGNPAPDQGNPLRDTMDYLSDKE